MSTTIERMAKETVRSMYDEAAHEPDDQLRMALAKHAAASEKRERIAAMIALARSEPGIAVRPEQLDANPWLLNTPSGTVNLRDGTCYPHRPEDLLTRITTAAYLPANEAECPTWEAALEKIFAGNVELIGFVQRLLGYSLAGVTTEHVLPILYGSGSNGKSVFIDAILHALGADYACTLAPDMLLATRNEQHPTWRMDLFGRRFVAAVETDEGRRLAEGTVKSLTGGEPVKGHRMREDWTAFSPTHTLWLATNHKPVVTGTDHAIWRRLRLIPFTQRFWSGDRGESGPPELKADPSLADKLHREADGILRWLVDGCLAWQRDGLGDPPEVRAATADYRADMDVLGAFIGERCDLRPDATAKASELYEAYKKWAVESGERAISSRRFGRTMTERGFERYRNDGIRYLGIDVRNW